MNENTYPPIPPARRTALQALYDSAVRPLTDQQPEAVRDQVEAAFAEPPAGADAVNAWFEKHFHQPPVSHDTALFNQLQALKAAVRDAVSAGAG